MKLTLQLKNGEVFDNAGNKLTIVPNATRPGTEEVKIAGLEGSNGQKRIALRKLIEGTHEYDCKPGASTGKSGVRHNTYTLTPEEQQEVEQLEARIAEIKAAAQARYIPKLNLSKIDPNNLTDEERIAHIAQLNQLIAQLS